MTNEADCIESIKKEIIIYERHLRVLKEQAARYGMEPPPKIVLEIEDIQEKIEVLKAQLPKKALAEVTIDDEPNKFSSEKIDDTRRVIAAMLNIQTEQIQITFARVGSVVLLVQMPQKALDYLIELYEANNPALQDLKIRQLRVISDLANFKLEKADLRGFDFFDCNLRQANLSRANLRGVDLRGANLRDADLSETDLSKTNMKGAFLYWANLSKANLTSANLSEAFLEESNLSEALIDDTTQIDKKWRLVWEIVSQGAKSKDLTGVDLRCANLRKADLRRANLSKADLSGANLIRANLQEADLSEANLSNANLSGAKLTRANLSKANLSKAYLNKANLTSANLSGADLRGADLSDTNLRTTNLENVILDQQTKRPSQFEKDFIFDE